MDRRRALAWLAAGLSAAASPALSRQAATIRGRVTDAASGRPLASVRVSVSHPAARAVTNAQGEFHLVVPLEASSQAARLTAEATGFAASTRFVTLVSGHTVTADFMLAPPAVGLGDLLRR